MRTNFTPSQLTDPHLAEAERSLRTCVHCGICTATCPTYVLLGDERDGPRGRIVMIQHMLEENTAPTPETVRHIDRCLSCLACRTSCPSSVDYARLVDTARVHIQTRYRRPVGDRLMRWLIAKVMTRPGLVRVGLGLAPLGRILPGRLGVMARLGTKAKRRAAHAPPPEVATGDRRIALMPGCVQEALAPGIDEAMARVLARRDIALVPLAGAGCCGSLVHHLGRSEEAKAFARRAIQAFEASGCDGVLITATGCSAHLKDLAHLFADEPAWAPRAASFAAKALDPLELVEARGTAPRRLRVAWQAPCSLQNGLKLADKGRKLLADCGYEVADIPEGHLCCGSAGSYSILQPEIADALRTRKLGNIAGLAPDIVATANIGCLHHLAGPGAPPMVHWAELVDWADGGAEPGRLR
ncbi:MAG TPA: glycolate oxidase subunit GlcF [Rhizomicrobium sp.]|nr:glycolate oxidase subunit GlcF [Rhizomicrobium sp.]